jgi:hypothetical protein
VNVLGVPTSLPDGIGSGLGLKLHMPISLPTASSKTTTVCSSVSVPRYSPRTQSLTAFSHGFPWPPHEKLLKGGCFFGLSRMRAGRSGSTMLVMKA